MNIHTNKIQDNKSQSVASGGSHLQSEVESAFQFVDNRPEAVAQRKLQGVISHNFSTRQLKDNKGTMQLAIDYETTCEGLNDGGEMLNREAVIDAIQRRWPHLDGERIELILDRDVIAKGGSAWTASQIHVAFKKLVTAELPVPAEGGGRPPSLYTHTHTPVGNQISALGIPQGPHTLAYGAIHEALYVGHGGAVPRERFNDQIRTPDNWWAAVIAELSQPQQNDEELQQRLNRVRISYNAYHTEALALFDGVMDAPQLKILMEHMMQLDPYATYAWANMHSNPNVDGHGENTDINAERNVDRNGVFHDPAELDAYIDRRRGLV
jgi:hypothetical protein